MSGVRRPQMGIAYETDPEVQLMLRVREDDGGAFAELVKLVSDPLLSFMFRQIGDQQAAEDLAQEALHRAWAARKTYRPDARFRTWLFRIARNLTLNRIRYDGYRASTSLDAPAQDGDLPLGANLGDGSAPVPSARMEQTELAVRVRSAVDELPESQRTAVILLRFDELSYEEIAATMDLSIQAVKSLLNRAKENLRRALAPEIDRYLTIDDRNLAKRG